MAGEGSCSGRAIGGSSSQGGKTSGDTGWRQPQEIKEEIQKLDSDWGGLSISPGGKTDWRQQPQLWLEMQMDPDIRCCKKERKKVELI